MRKILVLLLVLVMSFSLYPVAKAADFSDVPSSHWAYTAINEMKNRNILDGYEDGTFLPDNFVTRAETAKILCGIAGLVEGTGKYSDVNSDDWYYTYARDCGAYMDCKNNLFDGNTFMTREGVADAVVQILKLDNSGSDDIAIFKDKGDIGKKGSVAAAVKAGFISGFDDGTFRGNDNVTRAQVCSILQRAFKDYQNPDTTPAEKTWTVTKIANAKLDNFLLNATLDEKGKLIFIESEEDEILFQIDLPEGKTQRETMWKVTKFLLHKSEEDNTVGYSGFVPLQVFYDNFNNKTLLFGYFTLYTDKDKSLYEVKKYTTLDITYSVFNYTEFEEGKVQYKENYEPQFLYQYNEKYAVVFDGYHSINRFKIDNGTRQGKMYTGDEKTFRAFLNDGEKMIGIDKNWNFAEYDFGNLEWKKPFTAVKADVCGVRDKKFWFWDKADGTIFTTTPGGVSKTLYNNIKLDNIDFKCDVNLDKLSDGMLVINDHSFILYDGASFLLLEKK